MSVRFGNRAFGLAQSATFTIVPIVDSSLDQQRVYDQLSCGDLGYVVVRIALFGVATVKDGHNQELAARYKVGAG